MDFFKFNPTGEQTFLERGEFINNLTNSMWVERYDTPGEFSFETKLSSGLREFLPLGTLISHIDTLEVMIVENHEIKETIEEDPSVVISGRSFPSYFENRVVGTIYQRSNASLYPYNLNAANSWDQIVTLINDHIGTGAVAGDQLANISIVSSVSGSGTSTARTIDRGTLWDRVAELLKIDNVGIKTIRRNQFHGDNVPNTSIVIYKGVDKSADVWFSWKSGDIDSANYLFTQKNDKNSAMVVGQYLSTVVDTGPDKYDRRMMIIDATDLDGDLGEKPQGGVITPIITAMTTRALQTLAKQNLITISEAEISKTTRRQYRRDFNIGDLVTLDGNYNSTAVMRVVEYAEIEDENGESGHPTLALPGG